MFKRFLIVMFALTLFFNSSASAAQAFNSDDVYKNAICYIAPDIVNRNNVKTVSRGDCISAVMKVIGVTEEEAEYQESHYVIFDAFIRDCYGSEYSKYIVIAMRCEVAQGIGYYEEVELYDGEKAELVTSYFEPEKDVTVKECLTFMLRCLTDPKTVSWENVMQDSVKCGLLTEEELSTYSENEPLTNRQFYVLLSRMLNQKRYLYWPIEEPEDEFMKSAKTDETGSMTYLEWIAEVNKEV